MGTPENPLVHGMLEMVKEYVLLEENKTVFKEQLVDPLVEHMGRQLLPMIIVFMTFLMLIFLMIIYVIYVVLKK